MTCFHIETSGDTPSLVRREAVGESPSTRPVGQVQS